jgi:hypothetical protein
MAIGGFSAIVNISIGIMMALEENYPVASWLDTNMVWSMSPAGTGTRKRTGEHLTRCLRIICCLARYNLDEGGEE